MVLPVIRALLCGHVNNNKFDPINKMNITDVVLAAMIVGSLTSRCHGIITATVLILLLSLYSYQSAGHDVPDNSPHRLFEQFDHFCSTRAIPWSLTSHSLSMMVSTHDVFDWPVQYVEVSSRDRAHIMDRGMLRESGLHLLTWPGQSIQYSRFDHIFLRSTTAHSPLIMVTFTHFHDGSLYQLASWGPEVYKPGHFKLANNETEKFVHNSKFSVPQELDTYSQYSPASSDRCTDEFWAHFLAPLLC